MARYLVAGGSGLWNNTNNWSATDGGASGASFPVNGDDVFFTTASANANITVNVSSACTTLTVQGTYAGTLTMTGSLSVAGSVTLLSTMTIAGAASLTISTTATLTSNSKTWPNGLIFSGASTTKTLADDWTVGGTFTLNSATQIVNGNTLNIAGGLTHSAGGSSGTTTLVLNGTGTWTGTAALQNSLTINTAGTITLGASISYNTGTLTYTAGTVVTTGNTLTIGASTTLNTAGISWNNITISANATLTLNSLLTATGTFTVAAGITAILAGAFGFVVANLTFSNVSVVTQTFANGVEYIVTTALNVSTSRTGSIVTITSDHATNKAILTLRNQATCNLLAAMTRIDASNGRPLLTFNGIVTDCINVFSYTNVALDYPVKFDRGGRRKSLYNRPKSVRYST